MTDIASSSRNELLHVFPLALLTIHPTNYTDRRVNVAVYMRKSLLTYCRDMILHDHSPPLLAQSTSRNGLQHSVRRSPTCPAVGSSRFTVQHIAVNTALSPTIIKVITRFPLAHTHTCHI